MIRKREISFKLTNRIYSNFARVWQFSFGAYSHKNWMNFSAFLRDILCLVNLITNAGVGDFTN